jgi:hypothetical protein
MIQISPIALGDMGKRILTNISKYIVDQQQTNDDEENMSTSFLPGHFTLLPDEPHSDPEIGADTRVKVMLKSFFFLTKLINCRSNSVN